MSFLLSICGGWEEGNGWKLRAEERNSRVVGDRLFMDVVTIAQRRRGKKKKKLVELTSYCLCRRRRPSREQSIQGFKDLLSFLPFCTNYSFSSCSFFFFLKNHLVLDFQARGLSCALQLWWDLFACIQSGWGDFSLFFLDRLMAVLEDDDVVLYGPQSKNSLTLGHFQWGGKK